MKISPTAAFYLQASLIVSFLAGSSAPTPLYALYRTQWGFTPVTTTVIFGIYALAVLSALLVFGRLSDFVGRRPVLLVATLAQIVAMAVFTTAEGVPGLIGARIVQGIATGAAAGAIGAGMLDIDRARGTIANAVAPMVGTASGSIMSGLLVQYLPAPEHLVYMVLLLVFLAQAALLIVMPESVSRRPGAVTSLRPKFALPVAVRRPMLVALPALVAAWALVGFYGSLGPILVRRLAGNGSVILGALSLFVLAGSGALGLLRLHARGAGALMRIGTGGLLLGVALTLLAISLDPAAGARQGVPSSGVPAVAVLIGFFVGTAIAGVGFGAAFQGAIHLVVPVARPQERAGVLSILYVISYLAMGLPAILGGIRVVHSAGLMVTAHEYGIVVMVLAAMALVGTVSRREPTLYSIARRQTDE